MEHLSFADEELGSAERRMAFIKAAMRIMRKVCIRIRVMYDLHYIKKTGFSALMILEDDVMRQLQGWYNKTELEIERQ